MNLKKGDIVLAVAKATSVSIERDSRYCAVERALHRG
jgi:hypothetical protein